MRNDIKYMLPRWSWRPLYNSLKELYEPTSTAPAIPQQVQEPEPVQTSEPEPVDDGTHSRLDRATTGFTEAKQRLADADAELQAALSEVRRMILKKH